MNPLSWRVYCFLNFLRLWKDILHGDVSWYRDKPDGSEFLTLKESFQVAWLVWMI